MEARLRTPPVTKQRPSILGGHLMQQKNFSSLASGLVNREADFKRGFAPVPVVIHRVVVHDRVIQFIDDLALVRDCSSQGNRFLFLPFIIINRDSLRRRPQIAALATDECDSEMRMVALACAAIESRAPLLAAAVSCRSFQGRFLL